MKGFHALNSPAKQSIHRITKHWISKASLHDFEYKPRRRRKYSSTIFSIIITIHNKSDLWFAQECINSVLQQTYKDIEIIINDHGTTGAVQAFIDRCYLEDDRILLIRLQKNIHSYEQGPLEAGFLIVLNNALFHASGEYTYFLSYDDKLSPNYTEEMINLFESNQNCVTAAPAVVCIDESSQINDELTFRLSNANRRTRYTSCMDLLEADLALKPIFSAPGGCMAFRVKNVIERGGFDLFSDWSQLYRFSTHGVTGFSNKATIYWRHHTAQGNKILTKRSILGLRNLSEFIKEYDLERELADEFSPDFAERVLLKLRHDANQGSVHIMMHGYYFHGLKVCLRTYFKILACAYPVPLKIKATSTLLQKALIPWAKTKIKHALR